MNSDLTSLVELLQSGGNVATILGVWLAWHIKNAFVNFLKSVREDLVAIHKLQLEAQHKLDLLLEDHPDERYRTARNR